MDTNHIQCFLSLTHTMSFTETALLLHLSQSTCSRYISSLEQELGVSLFHRDKRTVSLTEDGQRFQEEAEKLMDHLNNIRVLFQNKQVPPGDNLKIGILSDTSNLKAMDIINHFVNENKHIKVVFHEYTHFALNEALRKELVDIAITASLSNTVLPEMQHYVLGSSRNVAVLHTGHPLAQRESISVNELRDELFVTKDPRESTICYHILMQTCMRHSFTPHIVSYSKQNNSMLFYISCRQGISIVPEVFLEAFRFPLASVPLDFDSFNMRRIVMWNPKSRNKALRCFLDTLDPSLTAHQTPVQQPRT